MSLEKLHDQMIAADTAYVEKTGKQPYMGCTLHLYGGQNWKADIWTGLHGDHVTGRGDTPENAIDDLLATIEAIPSLEEQRLREFQIDLSKLIDKGRAFGIDVAFVNPLIENSKRLAENALTDQRLSA